LDFFIPHFIDIAKKSNSFRAIRQARFYLQHAERLVILLRECGDGEAKAWKYSFEIKTLREAMGQEPSHAAGTASSQFLGAPSKLDISSGARYSKKKEEYPSVHYAKCNTTQPMTAQGAILKNVNPFREKMELPNNNLQSILKKPAILKVPLPRMGKCDEQVHSQTAPVTVAQVHEPNRSERDHSMPSSPEIIIEVTDSPPLSTTLVLKEVVTAESTDF
jgi:hypothetical protein